MNLFKSFRRDDATETEWIQNHTIPFPEPSACGNVDFEQLRSYIGDKRIVWIGESSHGVSQYNTLKTKLVSFLHTEMDFKVIAFESGLSECFCANGLKSRLTAEEMLHQSIFSLWRTEENLPLFEHLKSSDLELAGFDFQPSTKAHPMRQWLQSQGGLDQGTVDELHELTERSIEWYYRIGEYRAKRQQVPDALLQQFEKSKAQAIETATRLREKLKSLPSSQTMLMLDRFLLNLDAFLNCFTLSFRAYAKRRDQMMAENLEWLLTSIYPNEKVIVWAHNGHMFKSFKPFIGFKPMGSLVSKEIVDQSYFIGLFMYEGTAATNSGEPYPIQKPRKRSLEELLNRQEAEVGFLDLRQAQIGPDNKWISRETIILEAGSFERLIVPNQQLDGLFFIRKASPPQYLKATN